MHALQHRVVGGFAVRFLLGIGDARRGKQVVAFGGAEPQRLGDACQRIGEMDTSRPCSIGYTGGADAADLRQLFAPQAAGAAARGTGQAEHFRRDALAVCAQECAEGLWPG